MVATKTRADFAARTGAKSAAEPGLPQGVKGARPSAEERTAQDVRTRGEWAHDVGSTATRKISKLGLAPFESYYPQAKKVQKLPAGTTIDTFDESQIGALIRTYWQAPASADLSKFVALAQKDPAFVGRKEPITERQVGRLFAKLPKSFPWGWRSRTLAATSHVLIDALLKTPEGSSFKGLIARLQKSDRDFPGQAAFLQAAKGVWVDEPERFPFAQRLRKTREGYQLEGLAPAPAIRTNKQGGLTINAALAEAVSALADRPEVRYDWSYQDFVELAKREISSDFSDSTFKTLRNDPRTHDLVPTMHQIRAKACRRLCVMIRDLHAGGMTEGKELLLHLHQVHGYPHWPSSHLGYFRGLHPDLVPLFIEPKAEAARAQARALLDAIKAEPERSYRQAGLSLGLGEKRVGELLAVIHRNWPDELPAQYKPPNYTLAEKKMLQQALEDAPLNATMADVYAVLKTEAPELLSKHFFSSMTSFYHSLCRVLGIESFREYQQERWGRVLAKVAKRSPPDATFTDLVTLIQDEYPGAYGVKQGRVLAERWKKEPKAHPAITALLENGQYPWERARLVYSAALAKRVAEAIHNNPHKTVRQIVARLMNDPAFAKTNPNFGVRSVHRLRSLFPKLIPFVDELTIRGNEKRRAAFGAALEKVARKVANVADQVDDPSGLTVAYLAREVNLAPHRVLAAIRRMPELFPWYKERPAGQVDLFLATRVAFEMEQAPVGTALQDLVSKLKADPAFSQRYPAFNQHTVTRLREQYPDLVPHWYNRDQILRSKMLVDALLTAKKDAPFSKVVARLEDEHPGLFRGTYADPKRIQELWQSNPELFPFLKELAGPGGKLHMSGQGKPPAKSAESAGVLASKLALLERIPDHLPLLDRLSDGVSSTFFATYECLAIQHLLGPQVALFETMRKLGMSKERMTIVGVPYSVSEPVAQTLADKGWDVRVPPLDLETWYQQVKVAMEERIASSKKSGRPILVIDDGGLAAMMFERYPELAKEAHRFKIVEQTTRGITVADQMELRSPLINVAQSWGKFVEGPMIGEVVAKKLLSRLAGIDITKLKGKAVGITGFGTIGEPLAEFLRSKGAIVTILDSGAEAVKRAKEAGFAVAEDRKAFFSKQDVIIGASGHQSMKAEDFQWLKNGVVLGSCSSKLVEIDVGGLQKAAQGKKPAVIDKNSHPPTVCYRLPGGREVKLLASGFPLNFDGDVESVPTEQIQLTMGLLLIGALQGANANAAGVHRLDPAAQLRLLSAFEDVGGIEVSGKEVEQAMGKAVEMLKQQEKKRGAADRRHGAA